MCSKKKKTIDMIHFNKLKKQNKQCYLFLQKNWKMLINILFFFQLCFYQKYVCGARSPSKFLKERGRIQATKIPSNSVFG